MAADKPAARVGAAEGLMPPIMELQLASRMVGIKLTQLGQALVRDGGAASKNKVPILEGLAKDLEVIEGDPADSRTWRVKGIDKRFNPWRTHLYRLTHKILAAEKLTEEQAEGISDWVASISHAELLLKQEASTKNLDNLSWKLLNSGRAFKAFTTPEIRLLETILDSAMVNQRMTMVFSYFEFEKQRLEKISKSLSPEQIASLAPNKVSLDGLTLDGKALMADPNGNILLGLKERYSPWLKSVSSELMPFSKEETGLLLGHETRATKIIGLADSLLLDLDKGKWETFGKLKQLAIRIQGLIAFEPKFAPVALQTGYAPLANYQSQLFLSIMEKAVALRRQGAKQFSGSMGNLKYEVDITQRLARIKFTDGSSSFIRMLVDVRKAGEATLEQSKLGDTDRGKLVAAIEALAKAEKAVSEFTSYDDWARWTNALLELETLYNF